jgi:tetratricopeptide (TPR) repeat protein
MKSSNAAKAKRAAATVVAVAPVPQRRLWPYAVGLLVALFVVFNVYWPAMNGQFLLDDTYLPYMNPSFAGVSLYAWIRGLRPLLMFSYWLNFQYADAARAGMQDTFGYHFVNVVLHFLNGILVFLATRKVMSWAGVEKWPSEILAIFAAGLFLLHPLQTESVSYVASRSETLSVFFVLAALVVFLYREGSALGLARTVAVLALFGSAVLTKEHTAVLPVLLLLTDYYWNPGFSLDGIRRNWRLYIPIVVLGALGIAFVIKVLSAATTAGFGVKEFTWYQYFFTECRVIWTYLGMFMLPFGQNLDPEFSISRSIVDHGAIVAMLGLLAVSAAAWIYRRRFPLASYGWFVFLILIAPTSSFVPIKDPFAERRLYLPFIGLLFITLEFLRRWKVSRATLATVLALVLVAEAAATHQRNQVWASPIDMWTDTVAKSPNKLRPRFQLAMAFFHAGHYPEAIEHFQKAAQLEPPNFDLLLDWAQAYDGAGRLSEAIAKLREAAALDKNAHVYSQIGMMYGKMGQYPQALDALATSIQLDPNFFGGIAYVYRGDVFSAQGNQQQAAEEYRRALAVDPNGSVAREKLAHLGR